MASEWTPGAAAGGGMDGAAIRPYETEAEREEIGHLDFFLAEIQELRRQGLFPGASYETIEADYRRRRDAVLRRGCARSALQAASALAISSPAQAIPWAARARELDPGCEEAWRLLVDMHEALGDRPAALRVCRAGAGRFPVLRARLPQLESPHKQPETPPVARHILRPEQELPAPSSGREPFLALGEFLAEHWQKLILCLAVLLIVVSSTVGAYHVLGPLLWSPEGKCVLALVYTLTFAAFGAWLIRWGAAGAGRVMLFTTLIVVPLDFALAAQVRLTSPASTLRWLVLAAEAAGLLVLCWAIPAGLNRRGAGWLAPAYFILSAAGMLVTPGTASATGFAAIVLAGALFLGTVWTITVAHSTREESDSELFLLSLGLLAYAYCFFALRAGALALRLHPCLYALPALLGGLAAARVGHALARPTFAGPALGRLPALLRHAGEMLAVLAFSLALSRPAERSALYSGNVVAVSLLGLALFATRLRIARQPVYLYASVAAFFVAWFGAGYFTSDLTAAIDEAMRRALGYRDSLPKPFKALNGLLFNTGLGLLALGFTRRWNDERLARHCHCIGLPLSLAAIVWSCFETKAAVLCLGGTTILYAAGAVLFERPRLVTLACAAFAGSALTALALPPSMTVAGWALGASGVAALFTIVYVGSGERFPDDYRAPLGKAAVAMNALALGAVTLGALGEQPVEWMTPAGFALVAGFTLAICAASPRHWLVHMACVSGLGAWLSGFLWITGLAFPDPVVYSLLVPTFGLALLAVRSSGGVVEWWSGCPQSGRQIVGRESDQGPTTGDAGPTSSQPGLSRHLSWALPDFAALTSFYGGTQAAWRVFAVGPSAPAAVSLLLVAAGLVWLTRFRGEVALVYLAHAAITGAALTACGWWGRLDSGLALPQVIEWLTLTAGGMAIVFWAAGLVLQRLRSHERFYSRPLFNSSLLLTLATVTVGFGHPRSMALAAAAFLLMVRCFPAVEWLYSAAGSAGAAAFIAWFGGQPDAALVRGCLVAAFGLWGAGTAVQRFRGPLCDRLGLAALPYEMPLFNLGAAAAAAAAGLAVSGSLFEGYPWTDHVALSLTVGLFCLLMLRPYPARIWMHLAVGCFTAALAAQACRVSWIAAAGPWAAPPVGAALALFWFGVGRGMERVEAPLCRFMGVSRPPGRGYAAAPEGWSVLFLSLAAILSGAIVLGTVLLSCFRPHAVPIRPAGWSCTLAGLLFVAGHLALRHRASSMGGLDNRDSSRVTRHSSRPRSLRSLPPALHAMLLLLFWWLAAPASPLVKAGGADPVAVYPVLTGVLALLTALGCFGPWTNDEGNRGRWTDDDGRWRAEAGSAGWFAAAATMLAGLALVLSRGAVAAPSALAFALAAATFAVLTVARRQPGFAFVGGLALLAAVVYGCLVLAGHLHLVPAAGWASLASALAACALLTLAELARRRPAPEPAPQDATAIDPLAGSMRRGWQRR